MGSTFRTKTDHTRRLKVHCFHIWRAAEICMENSDKNHISRESPNLLNVSPSDIQYYNELRCINSVYLEIILGNKLEIRCNFLGIARAGPNNLMSADEPSSNGQEFKCHFQDENQLCLTVFAIFNGSNYRKMTWFAVWLNPSGGGQIQDHEQRPERSLPVVLAWFSNSE